MREISTAVVIGALLTMSVIAEAQTITKGMSEADINKTLLADLNKRYPETKNEVVVWDNAAYGHDALYTVKTIDYLTRYNKQGAYLETLIKRDWDAQGPDVIKRAYDKELGSHYIIDEYWEVNDRDRKGYYLELKDKQGQPKKIWMDQNGKVFDAPVVK